jgi:hypothetical protein
MNDKTSRRERLRNVVLLCESFVGNLAFHRAGMNAQFASIRSAGHPEASFVRRAISNFLDMAVLDWCKLFGNRRLEEHHWRNIVADEENFEAELLEKLRVSADEFEGVKDKILTYRNEYVSHLDSRSTMETIPWLDVAHKAVVLYHRHIFEHEAKPGDLSEMPNALQGAFTEAVAEATRAYRKLCP